MNHPQGKKKPSRDEWGQIWFDKLQQFHRTQGKTGIHFDRDHVISFLQAKRDQGIPAWKRLKIVEGLICYRDRRLRSEQPELESIRKKLKQIAADERGSQVDGPTIEEVVGKIDPREADVIQQMRRRLRVEGKAYNTEKAYVKWTRRFMTERCLKSAADFEGIGSLDVELFLTDMAVDGGHSPSTQSQAFYGLIFLFEHVLKRSLTDVDALRAKKPKLVPTVMSKPEVTRVLDKLTGIYLLMAELLYGCGMRLSECLRLRIMDIDFDLLQIRIYNSKGNKSRMVPLPTTAVDRLKHLIGTRKRLHEHDLATGQASVWLPYALAKKYPNAPRQFGWQFLFASNHVSRDPKTGQRHRHHIHRDTFPAKLKLAVAAAEIVKHVTSHTFRHSFATHLLMDRTDIRTIQELLGHSDVNTTMIYTHVMMRDDAKVVSPLDTLARRQEPVTDETGPASEGHSDSPERLPTSQPEPVATKLAEPEPQTRELPERHSENGRRAAFLRRRFPNPSSLAGSLLPWRWLVKEH